MMRSIRQVSAGGSRSGIAVMAALMMSVLTLGCGQDAPVAPSPKQQSAAPQAPTSTPVNKGPQGTFVRVHVNYEAIGEYAEAAVAQIKKRPSLRTIPVPDVPRDLARTLGRMDMYVVKQTQAMGFLAVMHTSLTAQEWLEQVRKDMPKLPLTTEPGVNGRIVIKEWPMITVIDGRLASDVNQPVVLLTTSEEHVKTMTQDLSPAMQGALSKVDVHAHVWGAADLKTGMQNLDPNAPTHLSMNLWFGGNDSQVAIQFASQEAADPTRKMLSSKENPFKKWITKVTGDGDQIAIEMALDATIVDALIQNVADTRQQAVRMRSRSQLIMIGSLIHLYHQDHRKPPTNLTDLVQTKLTTPDVLTSPAADPDGAGAYVYLPPSAEELDDLSNPVLMVFESPEHYDGVGANALFSDGVVRWMAAPALEREIAKRKRQKLDK